MPQSKENFTKTSRYTADFSRHFYSFKPASAKRRFTECSVIPNWCNSGNGSYSRKTILWLFAPSNDFFPAIFMSFPFLWTRQGGHFCGSSCCSEGHSKTLSSRSRHGDRWKCTVRGGLGHNGTGYHLGDLRSFHDTDDIIRPKEKRKGLEDFLWCLFQDQKTSSPC